MADLSVGTYEFRPICTTVKLNLPLCYYLRSVLVGFYFLRVLKGNKALNQVFRLLEPYRFNAQEEELDAKYPSDGDYFQLLKVCIRDLGERHIPPPRS